MPLDHGKSKEAFSRNVATEMKAGKPQKQAVAIAYQTQRGDATTEKDLKDNEPRVVVGVKGTKSRDFRKKFPNQAAMDRWFDSEEAGDVQVHRVQRADAEGENSDDALDRVLAQCEKMDAQLTEIEKHCDAVEGKRFDAQKGSYGELEVSKKEFEKRCRDGIWDAQSDINRFGRVEVKDMRSGKRKTITVRGDAQEGDAVEGKRFDAQKEEDCSKMDDASPKKITWVNKHQEELRDIRKREKAKDPREGDKERAAELIHRLGEKYAGAKEWARKDEQEGDGGEDSGFYIAEPKADVEQSVPPNASPEEKAIVKEHNEIDAKRVKILNEIASEWNNRPKGEKDDGAMWKRHEALKRKEVAPLIKRQKDLQDKLLTAIRARLARKDAINSSSPPKPSKSEWKGHKYDPIGVQEQINKDKRIKPGEAKRIHSLLRGWRNDGEPAEIIDELVSERRGDGIAAKLDEALGKCDFMDARLSDAARRMDSMDVRNTLTHRTYSSTDPKGSHLSAAR